MRLPDDPTKFTSRFKYVELARFWEEKNRLTREKKNEGKDPALFDISRIDSYSKRHKETGIYSSVFQYDGPDLFDATCLGPLYFDLDSDDDPELALAEANRLVNHLLGYIPESGIRLYFSGGKGYHCECEVIPLGITPNDELAGIYRFIAEDLRGKLDLHTLDFSVYDKRRMWRVPNTRHQKSGLFKVECMRLREAPEGFSGIQRYAESPHLIEVPEQFFDPKANRWFREYTYRYEQSKLKRREEQQDLVTRFLTEGSGNVRHYDEERMLDVPNLLKNCSAVRDLVDKAHNEHFLTHYERLFLCSLFTYNDEGIMYLHQLLSQLDDYNFEISNAHIEDWVRRREYDIGGRPFTCQKAREVGITCSDCYKMNSRRKVVKLPNGSYVETEEESAPSPIRWAYRSKKTYKRY